MNRGNSHWPSLENISFTWQDRSTRIAEYLIELMVHNATNVARRINIYGEEIFGFTYVPPGVSQICFCNPLSSIILQEAPTWISCDQPSLRLHLYGYWYGSMAISIGPKKKDFVGPDTPEDKLQLVYRAGMSLKYTTSGDNRVSLFRTCNKIVDTCIIEEY